MARDTKALKPLNSHKIISRDTLRTSLIKEKLIKKCPVLQLRQIEVNKHFQVICFHTFQKKTLCLYCTFILFYIFKNRIGAIVCNYKHISILRYLFSIIIQTWKTLKSNVILFYTLHTHTSII